MSSTDAPSQFSIIDEMDSLIAYHSGWKKFSSYASFSMTAFSIVAAAAASVTAGLKYSVAASILAAFATVFTSLDKVLQFRERWDLHRVTEDALLQIRWARAVGEISDAEVAASMGGVVKEYDATMSSFRGHTTA